MFGAIGSFLLQLVGGPLVTGILGAYKDHLDAANNASTIAANLAIQQAQINEQRDALASQVVIAEQGHWWTSMIRPLFALPFVIYLWKVLVYDRVVFHTFTYDLTPDQTYLMMVVVGSYFGSLAIENATRISKRK